MKVDFIRVSTLGGSTTIARTAIALIESYLGGAKITLNTNDKDGNPIIIITSDKYDLIIQTLSHS